MKISGIYKITNKVNGKFYIGSAIDIYLRWGVHLCELRSSNHTHHSKHLQRAWDKYGEESFLFEIIEEIQNSTKVLLLLREQNYLDLTRCFERGVGYNICRTAGSPLGVERDEKFKIRLREAHLGKELSPSHKKKISDSIKGEKHPMFGKTHSPTSKQKMSDSAKMRKVSDATREKISKLNKGKWCGENSTSAKLTWPQVREIREKYNSGNFSQFELGEQFGVHQVLISKIVRNKYWIEKE